MSLYLPWRAPILYVPIGAIVVLGLLSLHTTFRKRLLIATVIASVASVVGFFYLATERLSLVSVDAALSLSYLPFCVVCGAGPVAIAALGSASTQSHFGSVTAAFTGVFLGMGATTVLLALWSNTLGV